MKLFVLFLILSLSFSVFAGKNCWSTGDPHYLSFDGYRFDMYGITGDCMLSRAKDDSFAITTRVKYGQHWANRGLNVAVNMVMDGNVFEHFGSYWKMNGVTNSFAKLRNSQKIRIQTWSRRMHFHSLVTGITADIRFNYIGGAPRWPDWYFDVYLHIPNSYYGKMEGLCGSGAAGYHGDVNNYRYLVSKARPSDPYVRVVLPPHDARNHFDVTYVPKKSNLNVKPVEWPSKAVKDKAFAFCTSLKLNNDALFHDCLADIKLAGGDFSVAKNYKFAKEDLKDLNSEENAYKKKLNTIEGMLNKVQPQCASDTKKQKAFDHGLEQDVLRTKLIAKKK